jgi:hypothetical protein
VLKTRTPAQMQTALKEISGALEQLGSHLELPEIDRRINWLLDHVRERRVIYGPSPDSQHGGD